MDADPGRGAGILVEVDLSAGRDPGPGSVVDVPACPSRASACAVLMAKLHSSRSRLCRPLRIHSAKRELGQAGRVVRTVCNESNESKQGVGFWLL